MRLISTSPLGKVLGSYEVSAWCMKVEFDMEAKFAFIGDYSGVVHVLTLKPDGLTHMTTLRGHQSEKWEGLPHLLLSLTLSLIVIATLSFTCFR